MFLSMAQQLTTVETVTPDVPLPIQPYHIGPYLVMSDVLGLPNEQHFATYNGVRKYIRLMTVSNYINYTNLMCRLRAGRKLWAPCCDNDLLDYDRLYDCVIGVCEGEIMRLFKRIAVITHNGRHYYLEPTEVFGTLHTHIQQRNEKNRHQWLNEDEVHAQHLFRQIIAALAFCHCFGIMVRDLRLRKIVFTDNTHMTIRFGCPLTMYVCENIENDTLSDRHGCPAYVSPEVIAHPMTNPIVPAYSGTKADMWSAGVLFYVMIVGCYPFYDVKPSALYEKIRIGHFMIPLKIKCTLDARIIIHSLLRIDATKR
jgi:serine/threonine protein kinase